MTDQNNSPRIGALQEMEAALELHRRGRPPTGVSVPEPQLSAASFGLRLSGWRLPFNPWFMFDRRHPVVRRVTIGIAASIAVLTVISCAVWWRLASGPISLDMATPWLTAAVEQNFGSRYRIQVGGTQLERDDNGRTALRLRDIVVQRCQRRGGGVRSEGGGRHRRLEPADGQSSRRKLPPGRCQPRGSHRGGRRANVFAGGERPLLTISPVSSDQPRTQAPPSRLSLQAIAQRSLAANIAAVLAWIDGLGGLARDGKSLDVDRLRRQGP